MDKETKMEFARLKKEVDLAYKIGKEKGRAEMAYQAFKDALDKINR